MWWNFVLKKSHYIYLINFQLLGIILIPNEDIGKTVDDSQNLKFNTTPKNNTEVKHIFTANIYNTLCNIDIKNLY